MGHPLGRSRQQVCARLQALVECNKTEALRWQMVMCSGCAFISGLRMGLPGMQPSQALSIGSSQMRMAHTDVSHSWSVPELPVLLQIGATTCN